MAELETTYARVRWRHSLIFRVILLCVVLVLCLLGSIYVITRHYFHEVTREMEAQVQEIADSVQVELAANPNRTLRDLESELESGGNDIELEPVTETVVIPSVTFEASESGHLEKVARRTFSTPGQEILCTLRVPLAARTEIMTALKNKYMVVVLVLFLITLGLMVYFITRILRPLRELSESCAQISEGNLKDVTLRKNAGEIAALERIFNTMVASLREKEVVEANLRQAQRLSSLGTLSAGIAHDIRNPLNAIKLLSGHAVDTLGDAPETAMAVRQIETIRDEVNRLEDIVSGFLSLARERELQPEPCRVDTILEECIRLIKEDAEARDVRLITELRAGDSTLLLDPKQSTRAVLNVLINALEATPRGGRVRLFSRVTDVTCEIEIRDDGPGLPREVVERAFDPYFTTKDTGTGLGLSITRGIIEEHGGTIALSSSEGQGCQVLITFPLKASIV